MPPVSNPGTPWSTAPVTPAPAPVAAPASEAPWVDAASVAAPPAPAPEPEPEIPWASAPPPPALPLTAVTPAEPVTAPNPGAPWARGPVAPTLGPGPSLPMPPAPGMRPVAAAPAFGPSTVTVKPAAGSAGPLLGAAAAIAVVVGALLDWSTPFNSMHIPAAVLWSTHAAPSGFKLGYVLIALGCAGLAVSLLRKGGMRVIVGLLVAAVTIDYLVQLERAVSKTHQSFTRFVGVGCWVTLAAGIALAVAPAFAGGPKPTTVTTAVPTTSANGGVVVRRTRSKAKWLVLAAALVAVIVAAAFVVGKGKSNGKHATTAKLPTSNGPHFSESSAEKYVTQRTTAHISGSVVTVYTWGDFSDHGVGPSTSQGVIEYDFPAAFRDNATHTAALHAVRIYTAAHALPAIQSVVTTKTSFHGLPAVREIRTIVRSGQTYQLTYRLYINDGSRVFVVEVNGIDTTELRFNLLVKSLTLTG